MFRVPQAEFLLPAGGSKINRSLQSKQQDN